ncbi:hypothetical protein EJB05_51626, partial [Eragrostis curvula]
MEQARAAYIETGSRAGRPAHIRCRANKHVTRVLFGERQAGLVQLLKDTLGQQQLSARFNTTMSFSSMVGTAEKVEFYGHSIVDIARTVYGHPHARYERLDLFPKNTNGIEQRKIKCLDGTGKGCLYRDRLPCRAPCTY